MNNEKISAISIDYAKSAFKFLKAIGARWDKAFFRFSADESHNDCSASYVSNGAATLLSAIDHDAYFETMARYGEKLSALTESQHAGGFVCLLVVDSGFDYKIKFEFADSQKWKITKLDGGTGMPAGLEA